VTSNQRHLFIARRTRFVASEAECLDDTHQWLSASQLQTRWKLNTDHFVQFRSEPPQRKRDTRGCSIKKHRTADNSLLKGNIFGPQMGHEPRLYWRCGSKYSHRSVQRLLPARNTLHPCKCRAARLWDNSSCYATNSTGHDLGDGEQLKAKTLRILKWISWVLKNLKMSSS